jgi:transcriptional regulator with XRE-family HTH domain
MNYGKAIRVARAIAGMEQKQLAAKAKLDPSHISLIEKGTRRPSTRAITKMCRAMSIPEPLFAMLAAERDDLVGIGEQEFEKIGTHLARFLVHHEPVVKRSKRGGKS